MPVSKATNWGSYSDYLGPNHTPGSPPAIHVRDVRLALIATLTDPDPFQGQRCLDVGCNDGTVATQLAFVFGARTVDGVDIDSNLVRKARRLFEIRASRVRPPSAGTSHALVDYFPMSAVLSSPPIPARAPARSSWPRVNFIAADWLESDHPALAGPYDCILALSVIKWIQP